MAKFRELKRSVESALLPPAWPLDAETLPSDAARITAPDAANPLLGLLSRGGVIAWRAAVVLGRVGAALAATDAEKARDLMRRCLWRMNEDSGNLGWGVPEAMGEIAAQSPLLAAEYGKILLSYVRDTGFADNYVDHAPLRRGAYWAVGRFAPQSALHAVEGLELLTAGLDDPDAACRGVAAWGVRRFAEQTADPLAGKEKDSLLATLRRESANNAQCEVMDGLRLRKEPAAVFVREALKRITAGDVPSE